MYPRSDIYEFPDGATFTPAGPETEECMRARPGRMADASGSEIREDRALLGRREVKVVIPDDNADAILRTFGGPKPTKRNV